MPVSLALRRTLTAGACIASMSVLQTSVAGQAPAAPARDLVATYCVSCHNERLKTGNLALDTISADAGQVSTAAETWEKVVVKLRSRAMPPPGRPRPDTASYDAAAAWLETELDRAATAHPNPGRPAALHRLNRTEYGNAVRELFGFEIDAPAMLPPDAQAYGFDTNADALSMEPALLDRYLTAAAKIARLAVGDPTLRPRSHGTRRSRATRTSRHGSGRPIAWAKNFRWARKAGSPFATISRWMASTSSGCAWRGPTRTSSAG